MEDPKQTSASARLTAHSVLELLGMENAADPQKNKPFAEVFDALGAQISLAGIRQGEVVFGNKPSRMEDIRKCLDDIVSSLDITVHDGSSMRGKLQYADQQVFGNALKGVVRVFSRLPKLVTLEDTAYIMWIKTWTETEAPRVIKKSVLEDPPFLL